MVFERLSAELRLDASQFKSEIRDSQDELSSFGDRASSIGSSMQRTGAMMSAGITAPLTGIGLASLKTASEVEEMESKFAEVFQSSSDDVAEWADTHADEIGRSQNQLQEYAAGFGSLLDAMGASTDETADMSKELTTLTADLASFENMSEEQVQSKLESALAGQGRAVRDFGVSLSAAREEQILMNEGIAESREEATEAELAQARLIAIQEDTATAQGDAARTSESFANQTRALKADIQEMRAEIGQHLLPVATSLVQRVQGLTGAFGNLSQSQQQVIIALGAAAAALGPIALAFGTLLTMIPAMQAGWAALAAFQWATAIPAAAATVAAYAPIIATVGAIAAALAVLVTAWRNDWGGIQTVTTNTVNQIMERLQPFIQLIRGELVQTMAFWAEKAGAALGKINGFFQKHDSQVRTIIEPLAAFVEGTIVTLFEVLATTVASGFALMRGDTEAFRDAWVALFESIAERVVGVFEWLYERLIGNSIVPSLLSDILAAVRDWDIADVFKDALNGAIETITNMGSRFKEAGSGLIGSLTDGIKDNIPGVKGAAEDAADEIRGLLPSSDADEGPLSDLTESGAALPETLAEGMKSNANAVSPVASDIAAEAKPRVNARREGNGSGSGDVIFESGAITVNANSRKGGEEAAAALHREFRAKNLNRSM